jgi:hypothetical protein
MGSYVLFAAFEAATCCRMAAFSNSGLMLRNRSECLVSALSARALNTVFTSSGIGFLPKVVS